MWPRAVQRHEVFAPEIPRNPHPHHLSPARAHAPRINPISRPGNDLPLHRSSHPISPSGSHLDALARWPVDAPLAALWSARPDDALPPQLLRPTRTHTLHAQASPREVDAFFAQLGWHRPWGDARDTNLTPPPTQLGWLSYDLGRLLEPAAQRASPPLGSASHAPVAHADRPWPLAVIHECQPAPLLTRDHSPPPARAFTIGAIASSVGQAAFESSVERALAHIRAGDIYQVNLAHRLSAPFSGCPRSFFRSLLIGANPWLGFYSEHLEGDRACIVVGASPELFLDLTPTRIRTRPMKGTRPASPQGERELAHSRKDHAELAMIVDLMRNDLGRVCELASVRVDAPRTLERHGGSPTHEPDGQSGEGGLLQATATISGTPREGASLADILRATFPPGSVTGAPKIRAMQIIDELEPFRRGPYCGAAGLCTPRAATLAVNIRTACITGRATHRDGALTLTDATLDWWVGAGIVADSSPRDEWHETLAKASSLRAAIAHAATLAHA
jgi:para-aminobenzoate synthetase component I